MASDTVKSCWGPFGRVKGSRREPEWLDITEEDTEVGDAGEPECRGLKKNQVIKKSFSKHIFENL